MKYDFDYIIDRRRTDSLKWDTVETIFGDKDVLPMWVADMDFPVAKPITEALKRRTEHDIYGYTLPSSSVIEAVIDRMHQRYYWKIKPEWIVFTPGVIPALCSAVKALTHPGDEVIIQEPVYYPFWPAVTDNGCSAASNSLRLNHGHYEIDFEDLDNKFRPKAGMVLSPSRVKMMILCNPHNPVGRVWTKEELVRMGEIVINHDAIMVSDEIHCELLFKDFRHIPFASISEKFEQHSVICTAPSKTFNLAGLGASSIIIPNSKLRNRFNDAMNRVVPRVNIFGLVAMEAAYRHGDDWLEQLLDYLQKNLDFLIEYFEKRIPKIRVIKPEGTYLVWLDCRELGVDPMGLKAFFRERARVGLADGYLFGPSGTGFQRISIACPRTILEEALRRIESAVNTLENSSPEVS